MRVRTQSTGQVLTFGTERPLGEGGEARILRVPQQQSLVAKIYHKPTPARAAKLTAMLSAPPEDPAATSQHRSIAWPCDLLHSVDGKQGIVGFLMPFVSGMHPVIDFYHPKTRRQKHPLFDYRYLLRTARNLSSAVRSLHARGYVIGDVNESNILVAETALVTLVDTDSFQVPDAHSGAIYRCPVGKPEFTPPELQGKHFATVDRQPEHDLFGLGVLLFQLLMEGTHPFAGQFAGNGEPPLTEERISAGHFPHARDRNAPYRPMPLAPPFAVLAPDVQALFHRCFEEGHRNPTTRPDAHTWHHTLTIAEDNLVACRVNGQHVYGSHLVNCPWCERTARLKGVDPYPSREAVRLGQNLRPLPGSHPKAKPIARPATHAGPPKPITRPAARGAARPPAGGTPRPTLKRPVVGNRPPKPARNYAKLSRLLFIIAFFVIRQLLKSPDTNSHPTQTYLPSSYPDSAYNDSNRLLPTRPRQSTPAVSRNFNPEIEPGQSWTNSLGMEFTAVAGTNVVFSKAVTRVADYEVFIKASIPPRQWPKAHFKQEPTHPAVNVSWDDASAFCRWLTAIERDKGLIESTSEYRLPTDMEWSIAVGLNDEIVGTPNRKDKVVTGVYPWGVEWPPPFGAGNYDPTLGVDLFNCTSPVRTFAPNPAGLYDMGGNVAQWCQDEYFPGSRLRVVRGSGWDAYRRDDLLSSYRNAVLPVSRLDTIGFRCVIDTNLELYRLKHGTPRPTTTIESQH